MITIAALLAFPLGYFLRHRLAAGLAYASIYLWSFTVQTAYLTRAWVGGDRDAFSGTPDFGLSYALVTGAVFVVGFGLVALGHLVAARRRAVHGTAHLDPVGQS